MDPEYGTSLKIYSDCCYSGNWVKNLKDYKEQVQIVRELEYGYERLKFEYEDEEAYNKAMEELK